MDFTRVMNSLRFNVVLFYTYDVLHLSDKSACHAISQFVYVRCTSLTKRLIHSYKIMCLSTLKLERTPEIIPHWSMLLYRDLSSEFLWRQIRSIRYPLGLAGSSQIILARIRWLTWTNLWQLLTGPTLNCFSYGYLFGGVVAKRLSLTSPLPGYLSSLFPRRDKWRDLHLFYRERVRWNNFRC